MKIKSDTSFSLIDLISRTAFPDFRCLLTANTRILQKLALEGCKTEEEKIFSLHKLHKILGKSSGSGVEFAI